MAIGLNVKPAENPIAFGADIEMAFRQIEPMLRAGSEGMGNGEELMNSLIYIYATNRTKIRELLIKYVYFHGRENRRARP